MTGLLQSQKNDGEKKWNINGEERSSRMLSENCLTSERDPSHAPHQIGHDKLY
jgi:hypothetical protein